MITVSNLFFKCFLYASEKPQGSGGNVVGGSDLSLRGIASRVRNKDRRGGFVDRLEHLSDFCGEEGGKVCEQVSSSWLVRKG